MIDALFHRDGYTMLESLVPVGMLPYQGNNVLVTTNLRMLVKVEVQIVPFWGHRKILSLRPVVLRGGCSLERIINLNVYIMSPENWTTC